MISDILNFPKVIGKNLKKLRIIKELTVKELSDRSGVSGPVISQIENYKINCKFQTLRKILLAMDFSVGLFFSKIQDEIEDFEFEPDKPVQKKENQILLLGERKEKSNIKLLRPLEDIEENEFLEINIEPKKYLFENLISLNCTVNIIVSRGNLLIEKDSDEFWIKAGEHFRSNDLGKHNYRNIGEERLVFYMILDRAHI